MLQREVDGDGSPARDGDDVRTLDPQVVQQITNILAVGERHVLGDRLPEGARVVPNNAEVLGKDGKLFVPHPAVGDTGVDQQERMSLSGHLIVQACAGGLGKASFDSGHARGLASRREDRKSTRLNSSHLVISYA